LESGGPGHGGVRVLQVLVDAFLVHVELYIVFEVFGVEDANGVFVYLVFL